MNPLLAALLCLLTLTSAHAQNAWPRNPKTGKIEFSGALHWPSNIRTDSARQALAWDWYTNKLTTASKQYVERRNSEAASTELLTYAGLPKVVGITEAGYYINCVAEFAAVDSRLYIHLYNFTISNAQQKLATAAIEQQLSTTDKGKRAALAALRKRLAVALAGW